MAYVKGKSGTLDFVGSHNFTLRIKWSETYDLDNNKSILSIDGMQMQSTVYGGTYYPGGAAPDYGTLKVDGVLLRTMNFNGHATHAVSVNAGTSWWDVRAINTGYHDDNEFPWITGEIAHDADGTKSVTIEPNFNLWRENVGHYPKITGTQVITLTTIPRASTASVPNFTMGTKGTIAITRASSAFTHKLSVTVGGTKYQIASGVTTSYAWTPSLSTWGSRVTDTASAKCTMLVATYNGSTLVGSNEYAFTLSVPSTVVPTISTFTTELVNENSVVNGWGIAVKGYTKIKWSITAAGASGSTISKYAFAAGSVTGSASTGTSAALNTAGEITPTATVTDSRGRTATETAAAITVEDYKTPSIRIAKAERCDEDGTINPSGACVKLTFTGEIASVAGKNTASYQYRSKMANGSYGSWTAFESGAVITGFATTMSYVIEMRVVDALGKSISTEQTITTREEWLHGKEGGKGAAFGKAAEEDNLLDVAWDLRVRGNLILDHPLPGMSVTVVTTAGTNLDDYTEAGWYFFPSAAYTPANVPAGSNGWLQVINDPENTNSNSFTKQIWYRAGTPGTNDHQTYVRTYAVSTGWGAWMYYYTTDILNLVALNLNHITDTDFHVNSGDDLDSYTTPGAYRIPTGTIAESLLNAPTYKSAGGRLIVGATSTGSMGLFQMIIFNTVNYQIWYRIKNDSGTWGKWQSLGTPHPTYSDCRYITTENGYEWFNPPMVIGTEYRTTERWNNKVVYTKIVDCGSLTNGGTFTYSSDNVKPVRFAGYTSSGALPILMEVSLNSTYKLWADVKGEVITAHMGSGYSSVRIYVQVWYVK